MEPPKSTPRRALTRPESSWRDEPSNTKRTKEEKDTKSVYEAAEALFEQHDVEVHQKAHAEPG